MQFIHPWMLLGLILVPVAILLHVFRAPGRRHEVSSLGLWRGVLETARPEAAERVKRFDWLLLLEILVITLLVLGLTWPVVWTQRPRRNIGFIYDISASMKTVEADGQAREQAALDALVLIGAQVSRDDVLARHSLPLTPMGIRDPYRVWELTARHMTGVLAPADVPIVAEKLLADGLAALGTGPQVIFLVTDNPPAKIDDPRVRVVAVGGPSRNAGIVAFSGDVAADGACNVFLRVANYASSSQDRKLVLTNASKEVAREALKLDPDGASVERVFKVRISAADPVLRARLEPVGVDGLAADDEAAGVLKPLTVVATGKTINPAWARLFSGRVFDGTIYLESPEGAVAPVDALVIAEGAMPQSLGALTVVVAPREGEIAGVKVGAPARSDPPLPVVADAGDPLMSGVTLSDLRISFHTPLALSETARPLMRVGADVVAAVGDAGSSKVIVLGFDPAQTGWTLKPSFVVFWANVLAEARKSVGAGLAPHSLGEGGGLVVYRTGDVVRLPFSADSGKVTDPLGEGEAAPAADGWSVYMPSLVGVYEWTSGNRRGSFAANLLSEIESDNRPPSLKLRRTSPSPLVGKPPSFDLPAPLAGTSIPLGPWLCLAAGILAVVWWQCRR